MRAQVCGITGVPVASGDAGPMPGTPRAALSLPPAAAQGQKMEPRAPPWGQGPGEIPQQIRHGHNRPGLGTRREFITNQITAAQGEGKEISPSPSPTQRGAPGSGVTRALPNGGHWGSSSADPPMGDGAGAAHEAPPTLGTLAGPLPGVEVLGTSSVDPEQLLLRAQKQHQHLLWLPLLPKRRPKKRKTAVSFPLFWGTMLSFPQCQEMTVSFPQCQEMSVSFPQCQEMTVSFLMFWGRGRTSRGVGMQRRGSHTGGQGQWTSPGVGGGRWMSPGVGPK
ncbi:uncharacterized protein LOC103824863 isoform X10 [Serinus canaria]|uniref:uncharacterized protein LOC103824863 isoform X10 n=1 Tax=Serinus canaria TaxID=9135 RepID=UPI0021CCB335|nr:uncharacterized protein LOC103824863 isoform X10 [Serinus canaria]